MGLKLVFVSMINEYLCAQLNENQVQQAILNFYHK